MTILWKTFPRVAKKGLLPDVYSRAAATEGTERLKEVGWVKGLELAKIARRDGKNFDCATWLQKARELPKEQLKREVVKELTGRKRNLGK